MKEELIDRLKQLLGYIIHLLVDRNYSALETLTEGKRLKAEYLRAGVEEYGKTLVSPPQEAFEKLDIIRVARSSPNQYSIRFDLFTAEEGRSDLSIEITLFEDVESTYGFRAEIDGIHVL